MKVSKRTLPIIMGMSMFFASSAMARLYNAGVYINAKEAKFGESITLTGAIKSDANQNDLIVTIGLHRVSDSGVISSQASFSKVFTNQNFTSGQTLSFKVPYQIPNEILTSKYAMVMKAGKTAGASEYLLAQGNFGAYIVSLQGAPQTNPTEPSGVNPDVKFLNGGIYIPNATVNAGSSLTIHNSLKSDKNVSGITVKMEVRKILDSGVLAPTPIVVQELKNQSFVAGQSKSFVLPYTIPTNAVGGKYALAVLVNGGALLSYQTVSTVNTVNVIGSTAPIPVEPQPLPEVPSTPVSNVSFTNTGIWIPYNSVTPGSTFTVHNGFKASNDITANVRIEIRKVSSSGAISTTPLLVKTMSGEKFLANQAKAIVSSFVIPANAEGGKHIVSSFITEAATGNSLLTFNTSTAVNSFSIIAGTSVPAPVEETPSPEVPVDTSIGYLRGINIMDMGTGGSVLPGKKDYNYTTISKASIQALKDRGLQVLRLPFLWERVQYNLNGTLEPVYLGYIIQALKDCNEVGMKAILDMHNYARYTKNGTVTIFGQSNAPTKEQYGDAWKRIAAAVKAVPEAYNALYAYDLMNEPHDVPAVNGKSGAKIWEEYAQAAVYAIRSNDDKKLIHVQGDSFSAAHRWSQNHPKPFIADSANNIMYHAHMYIDNDSSGSYQRTFDQEEVLAKQQGFTSVGARGIARLKNFSNWCSQYKQRCFLGEFGWPNAHFGGATNAQKWNSAGEELMDYMDQIRMGGTMWATGTWFKEQDNILNVYELPSGRAFRPLSQAEVLERHLGEP